MLDMAVLQWVVRRGEVIHDAQNTESILVQLNRELRSVIGQHFLRSSVLEV